MLTLTGRRSAAFILGLLLVASAAGGCRSQADGDRGVATAALRDFRSSLETLDDRVDASVRAIDRLQSANTFDLQRAYMDFLSEFLNVSADATAVGDRAEVMRDAGADYFVAARKEAAAENDPVKAEELRTREAATRRAYDDLQTTLGNVREAYRVYRNQLNGINKYLNRNVTRERINTAAPQLNAARDQAHRVKAAIGDAKAKTDAVSRADK